MLKFFRTLAVWTLAPLPVATSCFAATFLAEGYSIRVWRTEDGLPQNTVTSAVQTRDGYLWFGTNSGLARFDGERFQVFDTANTPELPDSRITCLFEDDRGTLWIGMETGTLTRYQEGRFTTIPLPLSSYPEPVLGIGSDERGHIWAMRRSGHIDSLQGGPSLPSLTAPENPGLMGWSRDHRGHIWLVENSGAARLENGRVIPENFGSPDGVYVNCTAPSRDGGVWIVLYDRIRKWSGGRWTEDLGPFPWPGGAVATCVELQDGTLALGTVNSGLYLVFGNGKPAVHLDRSNGLPQNWVRCLYEDREGNLWVGAGNAGLAAVRPTALSVLNPPDGWQGYSVHCVAPGQNDSLWVGIDGGGLYHYSAGRWSHYGEAEGVVNPYIWSVNETAKGEVWMGNYLRGGPYRLEQGRFVRPAAVDEKSPPALALMTDCLTGDLLIGRRDGVVRLQNDRAVRIVSSADFSATDAVALAQDQHGTIWCAFIKGGLARVADGKVSFFARKDGLPSNALQCLLSDSDGALWIGTADNGLSRFKDRRFSNLNVTHGLIDNAIDHILDDGLGYFWLSTHHGLQRIAKTELNRCADGTISHLDAQVYDHNDGLPMIEFTSGLHAAGCKSTDGRLWFPSSSALVSVDPSRIKVNSTPPPVVIESLLVDGEAVSSNRELVLGKIPPDHQRLEFRFSGLSYVAPNRVYFKYRLEGFDRTWVDAGSRRTAFYSHLSAGTYRFRVIACNNDGIWNSEGAALAFTVAPFFWQTWWFIGSCAVLVLAIVIMLVRYVTRRRLQRRIEQLQREHAVDRERARIAQDIHDDIGASLTQITMLSQPTHSELVVPGQTAVVLSGIYSTARDATRSLDEIVWAIDPKHDTLDGMVGYMGKFAQDFLAAANIRCRLDLPTALPTWPLTAETRYNLFLAFKEALNNALKHAAATEVRISLSLRPDAFVLVVKDNGQGFASDKNTASVSDRIAAGNGLKNLERRLAHIGGRCEISTRVGEGTSVSFVVGVPAQTSVTAFPADSDAPHSTSPST